MMLVLFIVGIWRDMEGGRAIILLSTFVCSLCMFSKLRCVLLYALRICKDENFMKFHKILPFD